MMYSRNGRLSVFGVWSTIAVACRCYGSIIRRTECTVAVVVMMLLLCYQCSCTNGTELSVMLLVFVVLPLPEAFLAIARCVVIGWAGPVTLFSFLSAAEGDLDKCRNQKEKS